MQTKRYTLVIALILIILPVVNITVLSQTQPTTPWNEQWSFNQEITIPIETNNKNAKYQPIDIHIKFDQPCWAKNEEEHSIRVVCWDGQVWYELESQIYDLEKSNDNTIKSCSLVFLIPEFADGNEKYYLYYDDETKPSTGYTDYVTVSQEHYYFEALPGQNVNLDYYKITDEELCVYGVGLKGNMMIDPGSNMIFRQRSGSKEFDVKNWDQLIGFCFQYDDSGETELTTRYALLSNEIIVDGNIMVEFGIQSTNQEKTVKTTNFYKYYHCPTDSKRISVDSKSEISKDIKIKNNIERDGTFVFLTGFKTRSESNVNLNIGEILPYFHVYSEDGQIREYSVETNPHAREEHKIIAVKNDIDLGEHTWFSSDNGKKGKAHGIVFFKNNEVVKEGRDERDGIQVKGYERQEASLPGLSAYSAGIYCGRNSFEKTEQLDQNIPSNLIVEFRGELFTTETQGYSIIDDESQIFSKLIEHRPLFDGTVSDEEEEPTYELTVYVPLSLSMPLISPVSPIPLPITWVELYKNDILISAGATSRSLFGMRVKFPAVPEGECLIKIYKKLGYRSRFVGFKIVDVTKDTKTIVFCRRQVEAKIQVSDQQEKGLEDVQIKLLNNGLVISENTTDREGKTSIKTPSLRSYILQIIYKGFIVHEQKLPLLISKNINHNIELFDLTIKIKDVFGLKSGVQIIPTITSKEMIKPTTILPVESKQNEFLFKMLPSNVYVIRVSYEGITDEIQHRLPENGQVINLLFSPEFDLKTKIFDTRGNILNDREIRLERDDKTIKAKTDQNGEATFKLPPGEYKLLVYHEDKIIQKTKIEIKRESSLYLLTNEEPTYPQITTIFSIIISIAAVILFILRKIKIKTLLKIIAIALVILAIVQPWWELNGESSQHTIERYSKAFLMPQSIVTTTTYEEYVEAEPANIPSEFSVFLLAVLAIACIASFIVLSSIFVKKHRKTKLILNILSIVLLVMSVAIFSYGFSELAKVGLGSLQDSGTLNIYTPGINEYRGITASWGLSSGVYLIIISIILIVVSIVLDSRKNKKQ